MVDILEMYGLLLSREWTKCLMGWFSMDFTQLWLPWKGLNNQIKIDAEPKLKKMIIDYNAHNEIAFLQIDLGFYKVMLFDIVPTKKLDDQDMDPMILALKDEVITQFINHMMANLQCLGEEVDPNILLLPRFC